MVGMTRYHTITLKWAMTQFMHILDKSKNIKEAQRKLNTYIQKAGLNKQELVDYVRKFSPESFEKFETKGE